MSVFLQGKRLGKHAFSACVRTLVYGSVACIAFVQGADALTLSECDRITHAFYGGAADHRDLGEGRVMWRDWWSHEGTATSFSVVDCAEGAVLTFRTQEEGMSARLPYDRTAKALAIVARHESGARIFATFERIASDLDGIAQDIDISTQSHETCACAALYPQARGDKTAFKFG